MSKGLLSYREAAKLLGVDRNTTLKEMIRRGLLHAVKCGGRNRIPAGEVQRLIDYGMELSA